MSRKRKRKQKQRQQIATKNDKKQIPNRRFIVPLAQWRRFESFLKLSPNIQETIDELQENWTAHTTFLLEELQCLAQDYEPMRASVTKLCDLLRKFDYESRKREKVSNRPNRVYENLIAEILVEDVSDGDL